MKNLDAIVFDPAQCRIELREFEEFLSARDELGETEDLRPFFRDRPQLTAFIGASIFDIGPANRIAYEFDIGGSFSADIVIGNFEQKTFCAIELEDARPNSVFHKHQNKATSDWGRRFEHGFSQLVDWFCAFDDQKKTDAFSRHFGYGDIDFFGMLLIGRSNHIAEHDHNRLLWRSRKVIVDSHKVFCLTFDQLCQRLNDYLRMLTSASHHR